MQVSAVRAELSEKRGSVPGGYWDYSEDWCSLVVVGEGVQVVTPYNLLNKCQTFRALCSLYLPGGFCSVS